jgi:hypothetical protein
MSLILAIVLLLGAIAAWVSGLLNAVASGSWELANKLAQALPEVTHGGMDVGDVPVLAFLVLLAVLAVKHFRE